jgi:DNA (cytosine-5)-methyltransferase 1
MELRYGQREKLGRVDRLDPQLPSKTVIAGGTGGGGRSHLHPDVPRTISPREAARLQTFPDKYVFTGPAARQLTQIGNAVPPVMAWHLANFILDRLGKGNATRIKARMRGRRIRCVMQTEFAPTFNYV